MATPSRLWEQQQDWKTIDFQTKFSLLQSPYILLISYYFTWLYFRDNISAITYLWTLLDSGILRNWTPLIFALSYITCPLHLLWSPKKLALTFLSEKLGLDFFISKKSKTAEFHIVLLFVILQSQKGLSSRRASAQAVTSKWKLRATSRVNTNSSAGEN